MNSFLEKYASLTNKNSPIVLSYGKKISENIFEKKIKKNILDQLIKNVKDIDNMKYKISYQKDISIYKKNNYSIIKYNNQIDYLIVDIDDKYIDSNFYIVRYNIQRDEFIIPSFNTYDTIENFDEMTININNILDVKVKDFKQYYTFDIIIKKPNNSKLLENLFTKILL